MTGLIIYGIGALMFWPSGVKRSFGGFVGSMFIVGSGLSTLETSANPFIATCKFHKTERNYDMKADHFPSRWSSAIL